MLGKNLLTSKVDHNEHETCLEFLNACVLPLPGTTNCQIQNSKFTSDHDYLCQNIVAPIIFDLKRKIHRLEKVCADQKSELRYLYRKLNSSDNFIRVFKITHTTQTLRRAEVQDMLYVTV